VSEFKYLGKTIANKNYIHEEIKEYVKFEEFLIPFISELWRKLVRSSFR